MSSLTTALTHYYDTVPYDSHPFPQSAVEHLEAVAFLFGLPSPAPANSRVLEIGCAAGGNLIPFAARHPQARALGVDLSSVQVQQGITAIEQSSLQNVELRAMDVTGIDASFGQFDYIICHGVYSWVPAQVQDAILRVCAENLTPKGIAYISYNIYPGWKAREIVRDAMILRGGPRDTPEEKLSYARGMLEFLEQSAQTGSVLRKVLEENMPTIRDASNYYLLHEYLEPCNSPCYFKEFVSRAAAHGLNYLADAEPTTMFVENYGDKVREPLLRECGESQVMMEQYLDFLTNRTFRQTLLVKQDHAAGIRYRLDAHRIRGLEFAGVFSVEDGAVLTLDAHAQSCNAIRNRKVTLRLPIHKALAQLLDEHYPATISFDALVTGVSVRTGEPRSELEPRVATSLEELVILGAVRIRRTAPQAAAQVSEFPTALAAVRSAPSLALDAGPSADACNQWHEPVGLSLLERCLLPLLDGEHSHEALAEHLTAEARCGRLSFTRAAKALTEEEALREFAQQQVAAALRDLRRKGLLTS